MLITDENAQAFRAGSEDGYATENLSTNTWYYGVVVVDASENPEIYTNTQKKTFNNNVNSFFVLQVILCKLVY